MSLLDKLKADGNIVLTDGEKFLSDFFSQGLAAIEAAVPVTALQIIQQGVATAEATGGTGEDKLKAATSTILEVLETEGITILKSLLNLAIELAVQDLK